MKGCWLHHVGVTQAVGLILGRGVFACPKGASEVQWSVYAAESSGLAKGMVPHSNAGPGSSQMLCEQLKGRRAFQSLTLDMACKVSVDSQVASGVEESGLPCGVCQTLGFCPLPRSNHNCPADNTRQSSCCPRERSALASSRESQLGSPVPVCEQMPARASLGVGRSPVASPSML